MRALQMAPGLIWAAVIVGLMLLAEWLKEYFGGLEWVPPVTGFVLGVLVPVLRLLAQGQEPAGGMRLVEHGKQQERSWINRLLW